jgi:hypothetical protein
MRAKWGLITQHVGKKRRFPHSLWFFVVMVPVFLLQVFPVPGVILMFLLAPFWSIPLLNLGLIGIAFEAATGRVARLWLIVPCAFFGVYWSVAATENLALMRLTASYDAANANIRIPFNPEKDALVFADEMLDSLIREYDLAVEFNVNKNSEVGYQSRRIVDRAICDEVENTPALRGSGIWPSYGLKSKTLCSISMPERPQSPITLISTKEQPMRVGTLPVDRIVTTVTTPDGRQFELLGGYASPLPPIPLFVAGCALISSSPKWSCEAGFGRRGFTPIVSGNERFGRDTATLARSLGLRAVATAERRPSESPVVRQTINSITREVPSEQLMEIDNALSGRGGVLSFYVVSTAAHHPDQLAPRAELIVAAVERDAALTTPEQRLKTEQTSGNLAYLLAHLPGDVFLGLKPRLLKMYANADEGHWLWRVDSLVSRLGDLGIDALPYVSSPAALSFNRPGIRGLCRIGPPAKPVAEPILLNMWRDRSTRVSSGDDIFVAMRRIGIDQSQIDQDDGNSIARQDQERWGGISPSSKPDVCDPMGR